MENSRKKSGRAFVTGATGFLGRSLIPYLEKWGYEVTGISSSQCNLTLDGSLKPFGSHNYSRIFHLAAWTQAGDFCLKHPGEQWIINQQINTNVLKWWQAEQPQAKLVSIGTSCSYSPSLPLSEDNYLQGQPIDSLFTYGMTKRMLLIGQQSLSKQFGLKYLTVVPSTLYGSEYHTDGRQLHFIFDLIRKIILGKEKNEPVILWGDGHQKRELILVDDFARLLMKLDEVTENDLVNIGAGEEHSIREFAGMICSFVGYEPHRIQYDTSKYVGAKSKCLDTKKLNSIVGNPELTPLSVGLERTVRWFLENKTHFI